MQFKMQHYLVVAVFILVVCFGYYCYRQYQKAIKPASKPSVSDSDGASGATGGGKHPINQQHGTLKVWLSDTCPWCKKQVAVFKEEGIEYEEQNGAPPDGDGVPQTQSAKTKKVCGGFKEAKDLAECLQ